MIMRNGLLQLVKYNTCQIQLYIQYLNIGREMRLSSIILLLLVVATVYAQDKVKSENERRFLLESSMGKLASLSLQELHQLLAHVDSLLNQKPNLYAFYDEEIKDTIRKKRLQQLCLQQCDKNETKNIVAVQKGPRRIYGRCGERVQYQKVYFYFNVDLTPHKLTKKPIFVNTYVDSQGGGSHWVVVGQSSIYSLSNKGFHVYIGLNGGGNSFMAANQNRWVLYYQIVVDE